MIFFFNIRLPAELGDHIYCLVPIPCMDKSEALFVVTSSLRWVLLSGSQRADQPGEATLVVNATGHLSAPQPNPSGPSAAPGPSQILRTQRILVKVISSSNGEPGVTVLALAAWEGHLSSFAIRETLKRGAKSEWLVMPTQSCPLPSHWHGGDDDHARSIHAEATAYRTLIANASTVTDAEAQALLRRPDVVDCGDARPRTDCPVLGIWSFGEPETEAYVLHCEGAMSPAESFDSLHVDALGPCHLRYVSWRQGCDLDDIFTVSNVPSDTLVVALQEARRIMTVSKEDICVYRKNAQELRLRSWSPKSVPLIALLPVARQANRFLALMQNGLAYIITVYLRHDGKPPDVVVTAVSNKESNQTGSSMPSIESAHLISETPSQHLLIAKVADGSLVAFKLNVGKDAASMSMTQSLWRPDNRAGLMVPPTISDCAVIPSVSRSRASGTDVLDSRFDDRLRTGLPRTVSSAARLVVCSGPTPNGALALLDKGWPLYLSELARCDVGIGAGCKLSVVPEQLAAPGRSDAPSQHALLLFSHCGSGIAQLMNFSRSEHEISATAVEVSGIFWQH